MLLVELGVLSEIPDMVLLASAGLAFIVILFTIKLLLVTEASGLWKLACAGFLGSMMVVIIFVGIVRWELIHTGYVAAFYLAFIITQIIFYKMLDRLQKTSSRPTVGVGG